MITPLLGYIILLIGLFLYINYKDNKSLQTAKEKLILLDTILFLPREHLRYILNKRDEFCQNLKIDPIPIYVDFNNNRIQAYAAGSKNHFIVMERDLLLSLDKKSVVTVLAHELYHIEQNHAFRWFVTGMILFSVGSIGFFIISTNYEFFIPFLKGCPDSFKVGMWGSGFYLYTSFLRDFFVLSRNYINHKNEYNCDYFSVKMMGVDVFCKMADYFYFIEVNRLGEKRANSSSLRQSHPSWMKRKDFVQKRILKDNLSRKDLVD